MDEKTNLLTLLQVTVPPDTVLTVQSEVKILELLGIVSNHELVKAMRVTLLVVPPAAQATVKGLFELLAGLIRLNTKSTKAHHDTLTKHLGDLAKIPDAVLTYGTFLSICEALLKAAHAKGKHGA
ncbi:MAG TPA: hypothetical protein VGF53_02185 [Pseudolabrys sp.]|jgi:hypothetical protein